MCSGPGLRGPCTLGSSRTFFGHFIDKREVLFYGQDAFVNAFLRRRTCRCPGCDADRDRRQCPAVPCSALQSAAALFPDERRSHSRTRQAVTEQNPALQERESHKLTELAATIADALRARGVDDVAATLAAE
jgi:hypothetical protein